MATRLEQDTKRRAEKKKPAPVGRTVIPGSTPSSVDGLAAEEFAELFEDAKNLSARSKTLLADLAEERQKYLALALTQAPSLWPYLISPEEAQGVALWDRAVASLGRSAGVLEQLAESTGEAIARIAARGDRIDRIQKETRALLTALVASEADA